MVMGMHINKSVMARGVSIKQSYSMMLNLSRAVALSGFLGFFSVEALASSHASSECKIKALDTVYMYYSITDKTASELVSIYEGRAKFVVDFFAKTVKKPFEIVMQDMSVNDSAYTPGNFDATVSFSVQFDADYNVISKLLEQMKATGFSTSRSRVPQCQ